MKLIPITAAQIQALKSYDFDDARVESLDDNGVIMASKNGQIMVVTPSGQYAWSFRGNWEHWAIQENPTSSPEQGEIIAYGYLFYQNGCLVHHERSRPPYSDADQIEIDREVLKKAILAV